MSKKSFSFKYKNESIEETNVSGNVVKVVMDDEICLTCGGVRRITWAEYEGNKKFIKKACLFCLVRTPTATNRNNP